MAEREYLVLSAIGPDRPGLVAGLTRYIVDRGGNLEDSRMAVLGGSFGIMMLVSAERAGLRRMEDDLSEIRGELRLDAHTSRTTAPQATGQEQRFAVTVSAADREGIVQAIANALYGIDGNILSLTSEVYPAPLTGSPLFHLELLVAVPRVTAGRLEETLAEVARVENLDCEIKPAG